MNNWLALDLETEKIPDGEFSLAPWTTKVLIYGVYDGKTYQKHLGGITEAKRIVGHNLFGFDAKVLRVQGWSLEGPELHCTQLMASILKDKVPQSFLDWYAEERKRINKALPKGQSHRDAGPLSLKVLAPWYLKVPPFWENTATHNDVEYNEKDCRYTYELAVLFERKLKQEGSWDFYMNRLRPWAQMIQDMEVRGIRIDNEEIAKAEQEYLLKRDEKKIKLDSLWQDAHKTYFELQAASLKLRYLDMANKALLKTKDALKTSVRYNQLYLEAVSRLDKQINYASPSQMSWLLKDYLKLDITDPEGEETTGKSVLNRLAQDREDIRTLLEWKEADKVLTMYLPTYRNLQIDGIVHPQFHATGTRTGRLSSSGPNMQQVPPKLYRLFKPREGYKFIQYDLSGIEAALIALYSGDRQLYEIMERGESMHDHNVRALFGITDDLSVIASQYPKQRKTVKNIGFACFYGAGWRRIQTVFAQGGFPITEKESKKKLSMLKEYYPDAFSFHKEITEVFESGEVVHNLFGRPLKIQSHENAYMQGFNTLIQSSASDLNIRAAERAQNRWREEALDAHLLLLIHDAIIAESQSDKATRASTILVDSMTNFRLESKHGPIKLHVDGGIDENWKK